MINLTHSHQRRKAGGEGCVTACMEATPIFFSTASTPVTCPPILARGCIDNKPIKFQSPNIHLKPPTDLIHFLKCVQKTWLSGDLFLTVPISCLLALKCPCFTIFLKYIEQGHRVLWLTSQTRPPPHPTSKICRPFSGRAVLASFLYIKNSTQIQMS